MCKDINVSPKEKTIGDAQRDMMIGTFISHKISQLHFRLNSNHFFPSDKDLQKTIDAISRFNQERMFKSEALRERMRARGEKQLEWKIAMINKLFCEQLLESPSLSTQEFLEQVFRISPEIHYEIVSCNPELFFKKRVNYEEILEMYNIVREVIG